MDVGTIICEHGVGDGEGEHGSARHPPAGAQVGQLNPQHLHDHLVVQGQVEVMLVGELKVKTGQVKAILYLSCNISCHSWQHSFLSFVARERLGPGFNLSDHEAACLWIRQINLSPAEKPLCFIGAEGESAFLDSFSAPFSTLLSLEANQ